MVTHVCFVAFVAREFRILTRPTLTVPPGAVKLLMNGLNITMWLPSPTAPRLVFPLRMSWNTRLLRHPLP